MALVVERRNGSEREILGVGRLTRLRDENEAEFAILISDKWQGHGLGTRLLELLVQIGRAEGLSGIMAHILPENSAMQHVAKKAGFALRFEPEGREWIAELSL
jgi:acetyltransferase